MKFSFSHSLRALTATTHHGLTRRLRSQLAFSKAEIQQQARRFIKVRSSSREQPRLQRRWCC